MKAVAWQLAASVLLLTGCGRSAPPTPRASPDVQEHRIVVVRHAEKAPTPVNDPVLSAVGIARGVALDSALQPMVVTDVVVSHLQRTRLTAAAVIARVRPQVHVVPIGSAGTAAHVQSVADTVRAIARTQGARGILVVGHSNTVAPIIAALGGPTLPDLCDSQYSRFFVVTLHTGAPTTMQQRTYGAADRNDPTCVAMAAPAR